MVIIVITTFFLFILSVYTVIVPEFDDPVCSLSDAEKRLWDAGESGNCVSALRDPLYRQEFEKCKENICFLLIWEPPFVEYDKEVFHNEKNQKKLQLPFRCKNPMERHRSLSGSAIELLQSTSAADELCVWAGPLASCTWNSIVDFIEVMGKKEGYQFAAVGPMLETPQRMCSHHSSASWWDGRMVVVGRNVRENIASVHPIWQLISPFQKETWIIVGIVVALFVIFCLTIVYRFHVFPGKSLVTAVTAYHVFMGEREEALATGRVTEDQARAQQYLKQKNGSLDKLGRDLSLPSTSSYEEFPSLDDDESSIEEQAMQQKTFLTKFSIATSLFRISLIAFVAMFSLFYEVAVVNFLFQQQNFQMTKDIQLLTTIDLEGYCIVRDTALEAIWNMRVNPRGTKFDERDKSQIPWLRCQDGTECFNWVLDEKNPVQFYVTYELEASHLVHAQANCEFVTVFETKGSIHHFNSGWLFNEQVPFEKRRKLDRELIALKIRGGLTDMIGRRPDLCKPDLISSITFPIILLPVAFLVLPPLLCSAMVAVCWRKIKTKRAKDSPVLHL